MSRQQWTVAIVLIIVLLVTIVVCELFGGFLPLFAERFDQ